VLRTTAVCLVLLLCSCNVGQVTEQQQQTSCTPDVVANTAADPTFSIVVLPDTQYYSEESYGGSMSMFLAQMNWITQNASRYSVAAVIGVGDIVNVGTSDPQWVNADSAYRIIDQARIPYAAVLGNHDYDVIPARDTTHFNHYFGPARYSGKPWFGSSSYPAGTADNFYIKITANGQQYLILCVEFLPRTAALNWAQSVIDANTNLPVILVTHGYLNEFGQQMDDTTTPGTLSANFYGLQADNNGIEMWNNFAKKNAQIMLILCGHVTAANRTDTNDAGHSVPQIMADYQIDGHGGSGKLRILTFHTSQKSIDNQTFSPYTNSCYQQAADQFKAAY
jgi:hypothetical protein